jgi:hypothetical protein
MPRDMPKLFNDISKNVIDMQMDELRELRKKHPHLRDDQLMLYMLCVRERRGPNRKRDIANVDYAGEGMWLDYAGEGKWLP